MAQFVLMQAYMSGNPSVEARNYRLKNKNYNKRDAEELKWKILSLKCLETFIMYL